MKTCNKANGRETRIASPFFFSKIPETARENGLFPKSKKDTYRFDKKVNDKMEKFIAGIQIENVAGTCFTAEFV